MVVVIKWLLTLIGGKSVTEMSIGTNNVHVSFYGNIKLVDVCEILQRIVILVVLCLIMEEEEEIVGRQFGSFAELHFRSVVRKHTASYISIAT